MISKHFEFKHSSWSLAEPARKAEFLALKLEKNWSLKFTLLLAASPWTQAQSKSDSCNIWLAQFDMTWFILNEDINCHYEWLSKDFCPLPQSAWWIQSSLVIYVAVLLPRKKGNTQLALLAVLDAVCHIMLLNVSRAAKCEPKEDHLNL